MIMRTYLVTYRGSSFLPIGSTSTSEYKAVSVNDVLRHFALTGITADRIVSITIKKEQ